MLKTFCELWNIDIVLTCTGKIVFAAPSRPLVTQQIEACHNIVGIPQVRIFNNHCLVRSSENIYQMILIKLIAGMDDRYDRSEKSYEQSMLLEI